MFSFHFDQVSNKPSFYTLVLTGLTLLFILYITYHRKSIKFSRDILLWLFLFGILVGIHGILHHMMEVSYGYNPLKYL
jgi:hypothetical protein